MIDVIKAEGILINFNEHPNGDAFIVFMVRGKGFLRGVLKAEMRARAGDLRHFHHIQVSYFDLNNGTDLKAISQLKMKKPAEVSSPAF